MFQTGDVIQRSKGLGLIQHVGVYLGNNRVFHNHPETGEAIVDMATFSPDGQCQIKSRLDNTLSINGTMNRIYQMLQNPDGYSVAKNNCEDTVSKALTGKSGSPQRKKWIWGTLIVAATYFALKKAR